MPLDIAAEIHAGALDEVEGLLGHLVALAVLGADAEQPHDRVRLPQHRLRIGAPHDGELGEPGGVAVHVGAGVDQQQRPVARRQHCGDGGARHALDPPQAEERRGRKGARVAGGDGRLGLAVLDQRDAAVDRGVLFLAHGGRRCVLHADHLGRVGHPQPVALDAAAALQLLADQPVVAHQDHRVDVLDLFGGQHPAAHDLPGGEIATHGIDRNPHHGHFLQRMPPAGRAGPRARDTRTAKTAVPPRDARPFTGRTARGFSRP